MSLKSWARHLTAAEESPLAALPTGSPLAGEVTTARKRGKALAQIINPQSPKDSERDDQAQASAKEEDLKEKAQEEYKSADEEATSAPEDDALKEAQPSASSAAPSESAPGSSPEGLVLRLKGTLKIPAPQDEEGGSGARHSVFDAPEIDPEDLPTWKELGIHTDSDSPHHREF